MTKNYLKMLLGGFGIGCIIGKIYDWGKEDGKIEVATETIMMLREFGEKIEEAEKTE